MGRALKILVLGLLDAGGSGVYCARWLGRGFSLMACGVVRVVRFWVWMEMKG